MNSLIFFDGKSVWEFSAEVYPSEVAAVLSHAVFAQMKAEVPVITQLDLGSNVMIDLGDGLTAYYPTAEVKNFATVGVSPVRVGAGTGDHIQLRDTSANFALHKDEIHIFDATGVYHNGKSASVGEFPLQNGDCIWVDGVRIIPHDGYIECMGDGHSSTLNVATRNPSAYEEFPIFKRPPREIHREPTDSVDLNPPSDKEEQKKGALLKIIIPPLATAAMTIAMGIFMGRGIFMLMSAGMMMVTLANSVFTFFSDRKERRAKGKEREEDYNLYLLAKRKELQALKEAQTKSLKYHNLAPAEIENEILANSSRVYERASSDGDFLMLSLGLSDAVPTYKVKSSDNRGKKSDPLYEEMQEVLKRHQLLPNMPTVVDLKKAHLGLVGEKRYIHRTLASIMTQLCFFQSYHDTEIIILTEEEDRAAFEWTRWYPHCKIKSINVAGLISTENHRDLALGNIAQILKQRQQKAEESKKDSRYLPHYIFIADSPKLIVNHSIMEFLQSHETTLGFSLIYATHLQSNLPENIKTILRLDGGDAGTLLMNEGSLVHRSVKLPSIEGVNLEHIARKTAPLRHLQGISTQIPESVSFFGLYGVRRPEEIPVLDLWSKSACHDSLAVPLGLRGKDDIVNLNLHEKAHGPHGLVAGTTGSGKSEIVQSYILSLAANFHPHDVGFLLIDYKGGGMANLFENLPHLLGTITNLDGSASMRALASIKSELKRRQRIFGEAGVNNINQYTKLFKAGEATLPLPHLFIISDEFAELKKEQPDFMAELVSTARIGRSLGVHLILATQKPSGVVDDQIWSNSRFKLALKVANESDSNEVLKTPDAARITQPGRAYLQVGNNEIYELFQSAYSGAPYVEDVVERGFDGRVYQINRLGQGELLNEELSAVDKEQESKLTQLDVTVNYIQTIHAALKSVAVERPWLPPLEEKIINSAVKSGHNVGEIREHHLIVSIGVADIPEEQRQTEFTHDFNEDGNFAIFGASGSGKSTTLMNMALTLGTSNSPALCQLFVMDYGNSALAQLRGLPHTAEYITIDEAERLDKMMKLLAEKIRERKHLFAAKNAMNFRMYNEVADKIPAIFLLVDNYDVVREVRDDLEDFFVKLTRDGPGVGIYTIITASRSNAVRYSVMSNFKSKLAHFMTEKADVTTLIGRSAYDLPETRGRAMIKLADVHVAQCYLPVLHENDIDYANRVGALIAEISEKNTGKAAEGVRVLGETVSLEELAPHFEPSKRTAWIGFDTEETDPVGLDLSISYQVIVGGAATGKTNILRLLARQFASNRVFISDSQAGDLAGFSSGENVVYMGSVSHSEAFVAQFGEEVARLETAKNESGLLPREFIASQPPTLVLIDDFDVFVDYTKAQALTLEPLMRKAGELGVVFIVTTMGNKMKGYDGITGLFKSPQAGVVLGNPDDAVAFFSGIRVARGYKSPPDVGFWCKRGDFKKIKMPFVE